MKIAPQDYDRMRAWMAILAPEIFPNSEAVQTLDGIAAKSQATARKGLAMAVGDIIEMTSDWPKERVDAVEHRLRDEDLPTLSEIRARFSKDVERIVRRGHIRNEVEYYAVRNAADFPSDGQERLWDLIAQYEISLKA